MKQHRMYSADYQEVIIVVLRGTEIIPHGTKRFDWLLDTNGRYFPAESFVPFPGGGNF
jgi:hypothetical protein